MNYSIDSMAQLVAAAAGDSVAIAAPERSPLSYADLANLIYDRVADLNAAGINRNDPVAIVLPNGPLMAVAFVTVAAGATAAPLNPAYTADEYGFFLNDLGAKALLVEHDSKSPAIGVAHALGIPILPIKNKPEDRAGYFEFEVSGQTGRPGSDGGLTKANDTALILHTSGTTSRPKIVPLSQSNIFASATHIKETLDLGSDDICLNIMPLFHIHGLMAAVLSSLSAGSQVYCTPGFDALRVFKWMQDATPSWYTAVPTMHQAILARAARNKPVIQGLELRFIRSSSSSLPPPVMAELETSFNCPVIESYGMTEAAHQMSSNPLEAGMQKPGSVGIAAGPEIGIMDEAGNLQPEGTLGEIVIRGPNVTAGYRDNPAANAEAFVNGWFRTGDQGVKDADNFLTITGRLKEIINRGGEKISPREVDDLIQEHPAVAQIVTFAAPHRKLGEEVMAAIVIAEGETTTEAEIKVFASERLAGFKVPSRILFVEEIPKGATGKLQRIGLHKKFGL